MDPEGNEELSQSGLILQDMGTMPSHNGKRGRDQSEEGCDLTALGMDAQCANTMDVNDAQRVKAVDLNLSSDTVSSDGGGDGRENQRSYLNNLSLFQSEKRTKCGPSNLQDFQAGISSVLTSNRDAMAVDVGNNASSGMTSQNVSEELAAAVKVCNNVAEVDNFGIEGGTQFKCDICSVKSTSAKDLQIHLAGKRHARTKELSLGMGTSSITKSASGVAKSKGFTPQRAHSSSEPGSTHLNSILVNTSMEQQVLTDGSGEASEAHNPSGANMQELNLWASSSKCPYVSDANAVAMLQHPSMDGSSKDFLNYVTPSNLGSDNGHYRYLCMNGSVHNPTTADGFLETVCGRVVSEGEPYKSLMASLSAKSNSDCVARALASALSAHCCPGLGDLQEGGSFEQGAGCSDFQIGGGNNAGHNSSVTMHTRCFSNLLHDVRVSVMEDLFRHGVIKTNTGLPSIAQISAFAPSGEDLNCSVCRVEYGSKADLDLHLAGRKHASLVQRVYSKCQLCNLNCNTERDFKTHLSGKKHASKLRLIQKRVTF